MTRKATFGAGCFWGVEETFLQVPGVIETTVGYTGGRTEHPTYEEVCSGTTGHAEAVQVEYEPDKISYEQLLDVFWSAHDPTTKNRQGPDIGTQYRSAIFCHDPDQEAAARDSIERAAARFPRPIVTEVAPAGTFWRAEEYHQKYFRRRGIGGCRIS
jgi:peptide-methionine (S)-S-oxide reductase